MLILTSSFPRWEGDFAGCFVEEFARSLLKEFEITVVCPAGFGSETEHRSGDIRTFRFNYFFPKRLQLLDAGADLQVVVRRSLVAKLQLIPFFFFFFIKTIKLARHTDLICSHWLIPSGLIGALVSKIYKIPHISIEHSGGAHLLRNSVGGRQILFLIAKFSTRIFTVSKQLQNILKTLCPSFRGFELLPMGIDYERYRTEKESFDKCYKKKLLFLGRLEFIKGVDILLEAVKDIEGIKLLIAGDGSQRSYLEQMCRNFGVEAEFFGYVDTKKKLELLKLSSIVVIPSRVLKNGRTEGFPVTCLEAFASGRPVIAASVGGLSELVEHEVSGFLFEPENVAELRSLIKKLLADESLRLRLGKVASQIAANYDWKLIADRFNKSISSNKG